MHGSWAALRLGFFLLLNGVAFAAEEPPLPEDICQLMSYDAYAGKALLPMPDWALQPRIQTGPLGGRSFALKLHTVKTWTLTKLPKSSCDPCGSRRRVQLHPNVAEQEFSIVHSKKLREWTG